MGTIGLLDIGHAEGALRKMFVHPLWRGKDKGIASDLLAQLIDYAKDVGTRRIFLGTTERFEAARGFYSRQGFVQICQEALPASFPRMSVDTLFYYRELRLASTRRAKP